MEWIKYHAFEHPARDMHARFDSPPARREPRAVAVRQAVAPRVRRIDLYLPGRPQRIEAMRAARHRTRVVMFKLAAGIDNQREIAACLLDGGLLSECGERGAPALGWESIRVESACRDATCPGTAIAARHRSAAHG